MAKVLVLYYPTYGHTEKLARAVADGARSASRHAANVLESGMPVSPP